MARPSKYRRICMKPTFNSFAPDGIPSGEKTVLTLDEYEAIRLIDLGKIRTSSVHPRWTYSGLL